MDVHTIERLRKSYHERAITLSERKRMIDVEVGSAKDLIEKIPSHQDLLEGARNFLQVVSEETRNKITKGLEDVVTMCIQSVFGDMYSFRITATTRANVANLDFWVVDNSGDVEVVLPPETNFGGGMIDTISIGLRFGLLKVMNNPPTTPLILDEPAKMVSADRVEAIASLIKELTNIFDKQVIMITHRQTLMELSDKSFYISKGEGVSELG